MCDGCDFVIENGAVKKYTGPGGDVVVPDCVTTIGDNAFAHCKNLKSVIFPGSVMSIGNEAFAHCRNLNSVVIPESVTSIGASAFCCCGLNGVVIPKSVASIGNTTFGDCENLYSVVIPDGVTSIGDSAFEYCVGLRSVVIPESVTFIGACAFSNCGLSSVAIPEGVTSIGASAFENCNMLTSVVIPKNVTFVGIQAFSGCSALTDITLPSVIAKDLGRFAPETEHMIVLHTDDITNISEEFLPGAAVGFAEDGRDSTDENGEKYLAYIRSNAAGLAQTACGQPALLRLMIREKLIPAKDLETVIAAVQASGNAELMTAMRNYSGTSE